MKQSEAFERAIDVLHERGWFQGDLSGPDGSVCAAGALLAADVSDWSDMVRSLDRLGLLVDGRTFWDVGAWNDAPERTVEDVLLALKQCAEDARREEAS